MKSKTIEAFLNLTESQLKDEIAKQHPLHHVHETYGTLLQNYKIASDMESRDELKERLAPYTKMYETYIAEK